MRSVTTRSAASTNSRLDRSRVPHRVGHPMDVLAIWSFSEAYRSLTAKVAKANTIDLSLC